MNIQEWLDTREPRPPAELSARITAALGDRGSADASEASIQMLGAAVELMRDLLGHDMTGRPAAIDLLAVDALVTYAYEAAGPTLDGGAALALEGMRKLSNLTPPDAP